MAIVYWREEYSVRVPEIDAQHRRLLDMINALHEAMLMGGKAGALKAVMDELVAYTHYHFTFEEQLMARAGYSGLEEHKRKHRAMVSKVGEFAAEISSGQAVVSLKLLNFLKDWLAHHILETDKQYSDALAGHVA